MDNLFEFIRYGEKAELIIRDCSGQKIDVFKWNINDKKLENKFLDIISKKYGIFKNKIEKDKDLNWLKP